MTIRILVAAVGIVLLLANPGWAQSSTTPTASFDSLSPGNQKIANALFSAQNTTGTNLTPLTKDQIAGLKGTEGWGKVFKQMKADGLVQAKNLGQVVSAHHHQLNAARRGSTTASAARGRTATLASARMRGGASGAGMTNGRGFASGSRPVGGVAVSSMGGGGFGHAGMGGMGGGGMGNGGFGGGGRGR